MWPAAAPLVMRMHGYTGGVAAVYCPYPALSYFFSEYTNILKLEDVVTDCLNIAKSNSQMRQV